MNRRVLIVDDSLTVRMDLAAALEGERIDTFLVKDGAEARSALKSERFSVVILDAVLPDDDGVEILEWIRGDEVFAKTPVILLSTETEVCDRIRGLQKGADAYIAKPYDTTLVIARLRELSPEGSEGPPSVGRTVLVVDDSATYREAMRQALEAAGFAVLVAGTGEEGLRIAAERRPNVLIVDGLLPGIDGCAVVRRIRLDAALRWTPCLLLTGVEDRDAEIRALEAGADAFMRKDEDTEVVIARLEAVLRGVPAPPEAENTAYFSSLGHKKVLLIDNSPTYLGELSTPLRTEGYEVIRARSGHEALDLLSVEPVDCILMDVSMPGLDGRETCRLLKLASGGQDTPIILLSSQDNRDAMIQGLAAGADDFVSKMSDFHVLRARIVTQIRRRQFQDENRRTREQLMRREIEVTEARAARELAETRARLLEDLQRKNEELETFSYSVSHDLRAPLRAIDGFSSLLLETNEARLDEEGKRCLDRVLAATKRMSTLIDAMLALSRVGRTDVVPRRVDLADIANAVLAELRAGDPKRRVDARIQSGLVVMADPNLMRIVLDNLIGNAWKFTQKDEAGVIEVGAQVRDGTTTFFVRDNGVGFDMAYASRMFVPFQRFHSEREFTGTGIGLATAQRIVARHSGRIFAESKLGEGTTLSFTIGTAAPSMRPPVSTAPFVARS